VLSLRDADGNRLFHLVGRAIAGDLLVPTSAIFQIKGIVLNKPGSYTLDLTLNGDVIAYTQISVVQLQPREDYSKEVVEELLQNPKAIKSVRFKFPCPKCKTVQALQMNLDPSASASQGYVLASNENSMRCPHCGTEIPIAEPKLRARELLGIVPEGDAGEGATAQTEVELR
jgi:DNA-directed RNA polymerase subunit M/transcription elongation factor TFIIS